MIPTQYETNECIEEVEIRCPTCHSNNTQLDDKADSNDIREWYLCLECGTVFINNHDDNIKCCKMSNRIDYAINQLEIKGNGSNTAIQLAIAALMVMKDMENNPDISTIDGKFWIDKFNSYIKGDK
jgi:ribosomal protein S27AE